MLFRSFFDEHLDPVGDRLEKTVRADAVWAVAILDARENLAFHDRHEREEREKNSQHRRDAEQTGRDCLRPLGRTGEERKHPLLRHHENLVERVAHPPARKAIRDFLSKSGIE